MGADGGTIPKRCELVKNKKKREKLDKKFANASRWRLCHMTQQPLQKPIVACRLGGLYNKEAIINGLLQKTLGDNEATKHIRSLKDVRELRLTTNKHYQEPGADKGDAYKDYNVSPYCCPVTGLEMNGNHSFVVNWKCGCVVSERAIAEVQSNICHGCNGTLEPSNIIVLNPPPQIRETYVEKLEKEREKPKHGHHHHHSSKATKASSDTVAAVAVAGADDIVPSSSTITGDTVAPGDNNTAESISISTSTEHPDHKKKTEHREHRSQRAEKRKLGDHHPIAGASGSSGTSGASGSSGALGTSGKSIQNSEAASAVYKSLFTTCEEAKKRPTPHWITYNPLFY